MPNVARAQDFVDSLGINTHIGAPDGYPGYQDAATTLSQLHTLGIAQIRDLLPGSMGATQLSVDNALAAAGVKFDVLMPGNGPVDLAQDMAMLDAFARQHPGAVAAVEGPNEVDICPITYEGLTGYAAAVAFQKDLYTAVHADPLLAGVPVYNFTLGGVLPSDVGIGDLSSSADLANVHSYAPDGMRPAWVVPAAIQGFAADVPGKAAVVTETNYYTLPGGAGWGGVSEAVQAVYGLDTALTDFQNGVVDTYFYELEDEGTANDPEQHLGLFRADGSAKPFATALQNLTRLLADPGATATTFAPSNGAVSIDNLPWTASSMVLQKSSGTTDLVIWDGQGLWDPTTQKALPATSTSITVHLPNTVAALAVYDPVKGSAPIATYANVKQLTLTLSADPLVLQIGPAAASAAPLAQPAVQTIIGNRDGGMTLTGTAAAGAKVTLYETTGTQTSALATLTASAAGTWNFTSHARLSPATVHSFTATETLGSLHSAEAGSLYLTDNGVDTLASSSATSNVFALMAKHGTDVIDGFKPAALFGAAHDVIDLSGRGITSFAQVQSMLTGTSAATLTLASGKTLTLDGVAPALLTAPDFRFS